MKIFLADGQTCLIDKEDYDLVKSYKWRQHIAGYATAYVGNYTYILMHRLINNTPSCIQINGKQVFLGRYNNKIEAAKA